MQQESMGPYARSVGDAERQPEKYFFDPRAEFMPKYNTRRAKFQSHVERTGKLRVFSSD
jgi:hypothetical protein